MYSIVRISDGLGNQMFQYAFAKKLQSIGMSEVYLDIRYINNEDGANHNELVKFNHRREYGLSHFKTSLPIADERMLARWDYIAAQSGVKGFVCKLAQNGLWPWQYRDEYVDRSKKRESAIDTYRKNIFPQYFRGYYFDLRYYDDIKAILQKEFRLRVPLKLPRELRKSLLYDQTVSIHIRRGDYQKMHWDISRKPYYSKAVETMNKMVGDPVFLLFSDDIEWVKKNMEIDGRKIYVSDQGLKDYEEFAIMEHCKHHIIANSTFSYWAAYLNMHTDKIVIYPRRWRRSEIIPKKWIGI